MCCFSGRAKKHRGLAPRTHVASPPLSSRVAHVLSCSAFLLLGPLFTCLGFSSHLLRAPPKGAQARYFAGENLCSEGNSIRFLWEPLRLGWVACALTSAHGLESVWRRVQGAVKLVPALTRTALRKHPYITRPTTATRLLDHRLHPDRAPGSALWLLIETSPHALHERLLPV